MIENGVYIIKQAYFNKFENLGCRFKDNKSGNRPVFCCVKDKFNENLFWAIPTSKITNDKNMDRINHFINMSKNSLESNYYHIGYTNKPCIFCISSCFPITDKYIEREYTSNGKHLVLRNSENLKEVKKKLFEILRAEKQIPNRFEQKITYIKSLLKKEL